MKENGLISIMDHEHDEYIQTDRQTDRQIDRQTSKQTNRQTDKLRQTNKKQASKQTNRQTDRQIDRLREYYQSGMLALLSPPMFCEEQTVSKIERCRCTKDIRADRHIHIYIYIHCIYLYLLLLSL